MPGFFKFQMTFPILRSERLLSIPIEVQFQPSETEAEKHIRRRERNGGPLRLKRQAKNFAVGRAEEASLPP